MTDADVDRALVAAVIAGEESALARLYDRQAGGMLRIAFEILRNRADAEDLIHDVFLEVWRRADSYDAARGTVYSWLAIRVRSRAVDRLRMLHVARQHAMVEAAVESSPVYRLDETVVTADGKRAREALARLPFGLQEVVEMSYFQGLSCSEISARTQIPLGTVKSRLASAVRRLRDQLVPRTESF